MSTLGDFLERLLTDGEVIFRAPPRFVAAERLHAAEVLRRAHQTCCLDLAGPGLPFREEIALAAAELVRRACWFLVERSEPAKSVEQALVLPPPKAPADHLSADLTLRYAPLLLRRARAWAADDTLAVRLTQVLRQWPLSGVLADVADEPLTPVEFGGHSGLLMLYAERLSEHPKPAWVPRGPAFEYIELVFQEAGRPAPSPWIPEKEAVHE